ncbi:MULTISPECIES: hypothetical protein [unclassified Gammaproteobacteria]|uniref:hypothetical protein n=1 Tax=unclassified Gammaproteobacteria TaxID=33811 RepID=UPI001B415552|nr:MULTISPECIES: hypothetical protein [unclassified Gammaproteobacteria]GFO73103.1 hypothetical protein BJAS_P3709 [Bathymodiolus japonicus methanotrophic gill symbiont]
MAATNGSTAIRDKILASLARYRALRIGKFPCAFWRLSARPGLTANVLYDLPEKRKPKQRGRNKKYGQRLGSATDMARHATSQHSGTPVTNIHSPTQRMGDALVALRPSQLRTKPMPR